MDNHIRQSQEIEIPAKNISVDRRTDFYNQMQMIQVCTMPIQMQFAVEDRFDVQNVRARLVIEYDIDYRRYAQSGCLYIHDKLDTVIDSNKSNEVLETISHD